MTDETDKLRKALEAAREALCEYACHGGPTVPCLRSKDQCAAECGKPAGDALLKVDEALAAWNTRAVGVGEQGDGRVGKPTGLSSTTEPQEGLGPSGFDPSREIALLRSNGALAMLVCNLWEALDETTDALGALLAQPLETDPPLGSSMVVASKAHTKARLCLATIGAERAQLLERAIYEAWGCCEGANEAVDYVLRSISRE